VKLNADSKPLMAAIAEVQEAMAGHKNSEDIKKLDRRTTALEQMFRTLNTEREGRGTPGIKR
jgi:hypothetical protein